MEHVKMKTKDMADENFKKLAALFPNCVTEVIRKDEDGNDVIEHAIDKDKLAAEINGVVVDGPQERYQFNWPGKRDAIRTANAPSTMTLRPCKEESVDFDNTQNLYIEGDNLEVLKLLQNNYLGKVKMIYIDPPYNTGNDFVYNDDFKQDADLFNSTSGMFDENGNMTLQNFERNSESNGRFHTDWLNMMYPRLKIARNLLKDDGVIFISIDDNEQENLKKVCDEVFSEQNFINIISVATKNTAGASGGGEDKRLKKNIEYLLIYAKNYNAFSGFDKVYTYKDLADLIEQYKEEGSSWKYTSVLVDPGIKTYICSTVDGEGNEIKIYKRESPVIKSVNALSKEEKVSEKDIYRKYGRYIFETTNAQTSIRDRVIKARIDNNINDDLLSIEYVPRSGKNKGNVYEQFYKGDKCRLFVWLRDTSEEINGILYKKDVLGTLWDVVGETKNLTKEGEVPFPNGKNQFIYFLNFVKCKLLMMISF